MKSIDDLTLGLTILHRHDSSAGVQVGGDEILVRMDPTCDKNLLDEERNLLVRLGWTNKGCTWIFFCLTEWERLG